MGILIFGAIAFLVIALLVREAGAGRRAAMELMNGAEERGVVAMVLGPEPTEGPKRKGKKPALPRRVLYLVVKVRVCDVTLATTALKEAPQSHPNVIGGGGDLVRHVLWEVIGRAARKREEPYEEASFREECAAKLQAKGFELLAFRTAADIPYDDEAKARERALVVDCVHDFNARKTFAVSALEIYLDGVSKHGQWRVPVRDTPSLVHTSSLDEDALLRIIADAYPVSRRTDAAGSAGSAG